MAITNESVLRAHVRGNTTAKTGTTRVSLVFATVTTATQASKATAPTNPTTPTMPATATAVVNTHPYDVNVTITGGTVTHIKVNGTATGVTSGSFVVPSGGSVSITYSAAPSWVWTNATGTVGYLNILVGTVIYKVPYCNA